MRPRSAAAPTLLHGRVRPSGRPILSHPSSCASPALLTAPRAAWRIPCRPPRAEDDAADGSLACDALRSLALLMPAAPPPLAGDAEPPGMAALVPGLDARVWGDILAGLVGRAAGRAASLTPTEVSGAAPRPAMGWDGGMKEIGGEGG